MVSACYTYRKTIILISDESLNGTCKLLTTSVVISALGYDIMHGNSRIVRLQIHSRP